MMIAAYISCYHSCLALAEMTRIGCLTARLQLEGAEDSKTNPSIPQQKEHPNAAEEEVIADYKLDIDYEGSEPKVEPNAQEEKEENSDPEYATMEIPHDSIFYQRMMHCTLRVCSW